MVLDAYLVIMPVTMPVKFSGDFCPLNNGLISSPGSSYLLVIPPQFSMENLELERYFCEPPSLLPPPEDVGIDRHPNDFTRN